MTRHSIPLGRILGIPIGLDHSWFLIFALLTWMLAGSYYPAEFKNWPPLLYWFMGAATAIMLFVSVLLHELGHSVVALRFKVPVRSITLFLFGGVAQIGAEPPSAKAEFLIAIAGPIVSLALAVLFTVLQPAVVVVAPLWGLVKYLAYINLALVLFNLIPGFPLDGGRVFRAVIWAATKNMRRATLLAANTGRFFGFLFIFLGVWQMLGGNFGNGLWIAFIGWFLDHAASAQVHQVVFQGLLAGHTVSQAMNGHCASVPAELTLQQFVDEHILGSGRRSFLVQRGANTVGLMTLHRIKEVPRPDWASRNWGPENADHDIVSGYRRCPAQGKLTLEEYSGRVVFYQKRPFPGLSFGVVHIRKPDVDIFRLALDIAQEPSRQVAYIDNTPMFVQIAGGLGIRSILHTDYRSTCAKLASFGLQNDEGAMHDSG